MADDEHVKKLESLQQYIPFLNNMIIQLKDPRKKNREQQLQKMVSLHDMISDKKKKLKLETLIKCEEVIVKLYNKVKSGATQLQQAQQSRNSSSPSTYSAMTPCSPSPPPEVIASETKKPVVIPTEKIFSRNDSQYEQSSNKVKTKVDLYSSVGDSFRAKAALPKPSVFDRLGSKADMDMSKPPISIEDLEALQDVEPPKVDTDKMSLNELNNLKKQIEDQLNKSESAKTENTTINTTVRNTTILTKKAVDKSCSDTNKKSDAKVLPKGSPSPVKPVKVVKEISSIFGSALSSIDNKILEDVSKKEQERRNSVGSKKDEGTDKKNKETGDRHKYDKNKIPSDQYKTKDLFELEKDRKSPKNEIKSDFLSEKHSKDKTDRKSRKNSRDHDKKSRSERKNRSNDRDKEKKSHYKDKSKKHEKKENREKSNDRNRNSSDVSETVTEQSLTDGLLKLNESYKAVEEEKIPQVQPTFKRLADKYNPKPRKVSTELSATPENTSTIPVLHLGKISNQPSFGNSNFTHFPQNSPLLSPTNSTISIESDISNYNKKPVLPILPLPPLSSHGNLSNTSIQSLQPSNAYQPTTSIGPNMSSINQLSNIPPISDQVNSLLSNPNATAIIHTVVNQFKVDQVPLMVNSNLNRNHFNNQIQNSNYTNNFHPTDINSVQYSNSIQTPNMVQQSNMSYFRSNQQLQQQSQTSHMQSFSQRSTSQVSHQYDYGQQMPYFAQGSTTPNSFGQNHPKSVLGDNFQARPQLQAPQPDECSYNMNDRDARSSHIGQDWRRWSRDAREPDSRDPRMIRDVNRDTRNYREENRQYRRDSRDSRDPRDIDRGRSLYRDRDPRVNRYYGNSRSDAESRSPSTSRDKDDGETFVSPLNSLYSGNDSYRKTGKGYGMQSFKIPRVKKEDDAIIATEREKTMEKHDKEEDDLLPPTLSPQVKRPDKPDTKVEEEALSSSVSSSTEPMSQEVEKQIKKSETESEKAATAENTEISSTNEIPEQVKREDVVEQEQTEIINKFLKKLLENKTTRAAASMFIDNVSNSLDDEKLKMVVQTVKRAAVKEELDEKSTASQDKEEVNSPNKKLPLKRNSMRPKSKLRARIITDDDDEEDNSEDPNDEEATNEEKETDKNEEKCTGDEETKFDENQKERKEKRKKEKKNELKDDEVFENEEAENKVFVTVGERTKSRRRTTRGANTKKKKHKSELDLLHEDIQEMFIRDGVLTATGKRMCRLINDEEKEKTEEKPATPKRSRRSFKASAIDKTVDTEKIKAMKNVCVILPKISVEKLGDYDDENQRYSLRRSNKVSKSYAEIDSDEEKDRKKREENKFAGEKDKKVGDVKESRLRDSTKRNVKSYVELDFNDGLERTKSTKEGKEVKLKEDEKEKKITDKLAETMATSSDLMKGEENLEEEIEKEKSHEKQLISKEKGISVPKRIANRKRAKAWASGIILKKKQKRTVVESEPAPEPVTSELDQSLDFIEPDKNYFALKASHCNTACKLCEFTGKNITLHYRMQHVDSEILSSRLSPEKAEEAIRESTQLNLDDCDYMELLPRHLYLFKCRFCDLTMTTKISCFYDHVSTHTGEYRHNCRICHYGVCSAKALNLHYEKVHNTINENKSCAPVTSKVYAYICLDCNFVQIQKKVVDNHVNIYHLGDGKKTMRIYMSSLDYLIKDKSDWKRRTARRNGKQTSKGGVSRKVFSTSRSKRKKCEQIDALSVPENDDEDDIPISKRKRSKEKSDDNEDALHSNSEESPNKTNLVLKKVEEKSLIETKTEEKKLSDTESKKDTLDEIESKTNIIKNNLEGFQKVAEVEIKKEIDMTVFTCATNIHEENEKIEADRLKRMTELNETVKTSRQCKSNFVDQLSNRLLQEENEIQEKNEIKKKEAEALVAAPELVMVKSEPMDLEPESDMILEEEPEPDIEMGIEFSPKKVSKIVDSPVCNNKDVTVQRENIKIQGMIQKLQGLLGESNESNEIKEPPPLTLLKSCDEGVILAAGFLNVIKHTDGNEFACRIQCCSFKTKGRDVFLEHWDEEHTQLNSSHTSTKCFICGREVQKSHFGNLLRNFFDHVETVHLGVEKRNLLKTRRLSGDILSVIQDDKNSKSEEEDKSEENPFPFKIAGVMSLAEDTCDIPPLSPINTRTPSSKQITDIVLKESKLTLQEQQVMRKSPEAFQKFLQCSRDLYKCPEYSCKFSTNWKSQFDVHINEHSSELDNLMTCVYCDIKTPLNNASLHIDIRHSNCSFSCTQCLYRALTKEYVIVHLKMKHKDCELLITSTPAPSPIFTVTNKKFSIEETCLPYICGYRGCEAKFLFQNEYINHVKKLHCGIFICGFRSLGVNKVHCKYQCLVGENMVDHWRTHNCYHFSCLLCKVGYVELYSMLEHYATTHPNMEPNVVDRRQNPTTVMRIYGYSEDAFNSVKLIREELLTCVSTQSARVVTEVKSLSLTDSPKRVSSPKKLEPQKKLTLLPLTLLQANSSDKKIIIIPKSVEGMVPKPMKILNTKASDKPKTIFTVVKSISKSLENTKTVDEPKIDETELINEAAAVDPLSLDNDVTTVILASGDESDSQDLNDSLNVKRFGLVGYQLYRCAFCEVSFSNTKDFKTHISQAKQCRDETNPLKQFKCVHCERLFRNGHGLLEHIQYHGQLRFGCSLCVKKFPSTFSLKIHMRSKHNVTNTITTPVIPNKTNVDCDEFILRPVPIAELDAVEESNIELSPNKKDIFSPEEIDKLPQRYIFTADLKCSLCSYSTKVKTNLVRHLQFHAREKAVPTMAPVNPVPCLDKNEKMFDKMTNLAISSMTGSSRMGGAVIKTEESATKEHVEAPAFIPSHRRYACCAPGCNYLCLQENNLRHHLFTLHEQEPSFTCLHCQVVLKADIEAYLKHLKLHDSHLYKCRMCSFMHNLRHKVDKHSVDKHPEETNNVTNNTLTIRAMGKEPGVVDHPQPIPISTPNSDNQPSNIKWTKPWHCGMCKYRCAAKSEIVAHIYNKHDINMQFKCTLCNYKTNEKSTFDQHFKEAHPDSDIDIIHVYYKSESSGVTTSGNQKPFDTTPLWQRDRPRVRHIRGILFEESSQKIIKRNMIGKTSSVVNTSTSSTASSNLDLAIEAVATGMDEASQRVKANTEIDVHEGTSSETEHFEKQKDDTIIILDDDDEDVDMGLGADGNLLIDIDNTNVDSNIDGKVSLDADENAIHSVDVLFRKYGEMCTTSGRAFKCPLCLKYKTKKISNFIYHLLVELKQYRFKCRSCEYVCVSFDTMVSHCQDEHNSYLIKNIEDIPLRKSIIYWLQLVVRHQAHDMLFQNPVPTGEEYQTNTSKFQCEFCKRWFRTSHIQKEHELVHWSDHTYTCNYCYLEYPTLNQMFEHNYMEHRNSSCDAIINGPSVEKVLVNLKQNVGPQSNSGSNTVKESSEETVRPLYNCSECSATERTVIDMQKHLAKVHNINHLTDELKIKVAAKPKLTILFSCTYCHMRATEQQLKKHHEEVHTGLKFSIYQYICLECGQTFLNIKYLRSHHVADHPQKRLHYSCVENKPSGLREQYICSKCPFRSGTVGGVRNHIKKHLRPVDCKICGATFIYPTEGRAHHNKEHMNSSEAVEDNRDRLIEYENLVKEIVNERDRRIEGKLTPKTPPPPTIIPPAKKMFARKSTGAPFLREPKLEPIEKID